MKDGKYLIYAVDDEEPIRDLYRYALEDAGFLIECFPGGEELFSALRTALPDLFLLDIMLDGADGYAILSSLRSRRETQDTPVIMVSAKGTEIDKVRGLNLGADDYLAKPFGVLELVARIRANLRRTSQRDSGPQIRYLDILVDSDRHEITVAGEKITTTAKEYDLIRTLVQHHGVAMSRTVLLDSVWGENYGETRTLDLHIMQIRRLLAASTAKIRTIRGVGYMLE